MNTWHKADQNESDASYEDLLDILEKYLKEEPDDEPFLVKNGIKIIL